MPINKVNPYIQLNGTADKAIELYQRAIGAKVEHVMRFGDVPQMNVKPEDKNRVMHAVLRLGGDMVMLSDSMPDQPVASGGCVQIVLDFSDVSEMTKAFEALAEGGSVTMAPHDTFWGAKFGMLTDRFGVQWMFNCDLKQGKA